METHTPNMPFIFNMPVTAQGGSPVLGNGSQHTDLADESGAISFLQSLQNLVSELQLSGQERKAGSLSTAIEQLISDQAANTNMELPLAEGQVIAAQEQTEMAVALSLPISIDSLLQQIQQRLTTGSDELDPALRARITTLATTQANTVEAGNINSSVSQINTIDLMRQVSHLNQSLPQVNTAGSMAQLDNLNQALPVGAMALQQQVKPVETKQIKDLENSPLLNRDVAFNANTATIITAMPSAVLIERALLNMNQAGHQASAELLSATDTPLESLAMLQPGSLNRTGVQSGIAETRPQQTMLHVPLTDPQWQADLSNKIVMLAKGAGPGQAQVAEIRLNPAHMGPIEVRVVMNDDQASVTFTAQHGAVRDAIDSSLPRLREMFTSSGLLLSDTEVSDQSLYDRRQNENQDLAERGQQHSDSEFHLDAESEQPIAQMSLTDLAARNALDIYA